jgi:hypothetical protein
VRGASHFALDSKNPAEASFFEFIVDVTKFHY